MKIPTWGESHIAVLNETATPLDEFVHENEPTGNFPEEIFRTGLQSLVYYLLLEGAVK